MMKFLDLSIPDNDLNKYLETFEDILKSGIYLNGSWNLRFQDDFSSISNRKYNIGVSNGLDGLTLALRAAGIGPGDSVIVPSITYIATWLAVSNVGAKIIPVEPKHGCYTISGPDIEEALDPSVKCILPVHLYGVPCDIASIKKIAGSEIIIIEDSAQAHGTIHNEKSINFPRTEVYSFYPGKTLGAFGDAGAVSTDNKNLSQKVIELGNYGSLEKYVHNKKGLNCRLDEIQAAILCIKIKELNQVIKHRRLIASIYNESIKNNIVTIRKDMKNMNSSFHLYCIETKQRSLIAKKLLSKSVNTGCHYPTAIHKQLAYSEFKNAELPWAEYYAGVTLSLPIGPHISVEDAEYISNIINNI